MYKNKQQGLIRMIIIIIIAIAILSWYGVDIKKFFTSEMAQKNFGYIWTYLKDVWVNYLALPATKVWGIWVEHLWTPLVGMFK